MYEQPQTARFGVAQPSRTIRTIAAGRRERSFAFWHGHNGNDFGSSWFVYILPFIEQQTICDKWRFTGVSGYENASNMATINGVVIPGLACPSSPLPTRWCLATGGVSGVTTNRMAVNYVGISGAVDGLISGYTESRVQHHVYAGIIGGGGVLVANGKLTFADIRDGTSNVVMVSEHGNWITTADGQENDWRGCTPWGWPMGTMASGTAPT